VAASKRRFCGVVLTAALAMFLNSAAKAETFDALEHWQDWSVFATRDTCWVGTVAESVTSDMAGVDLPRQFQDRLLVTYFADRLAAPEISFLPEIEIAADAPIRGEAGGASFAMLSQNGVAWPVTQAENDRMLMAMLSGDGFSIRLTRGDDVTLRYRFSPDGLGDALAAARRACGYEGFA